MKKSIILIVFLAITWSLSSQSIKKYNIANTGCYAYMFCDPGTFSLEKSPDSSEVYTAQCNMDSVEYDIIVVKLNSGIEDLNAAEDVVIAYMNHLKSVFNVNKSAGYGKGSRLNNDEKTRGILDYWEDTTGNQIKIKGWTNGKLIAVLAVSSKADINENKANLFLDGIRFP